MSSANQKNDCDVPKLTFAPNNYQRWLEKFSIYGQAEFGRAMQALETLREPIFSPKDYVLDEDADEFTTFDSEFTSGAHMAKAKELAMQERAKYRQGLPNIFGKILLLLSEDSLTRVQGKEEYDIIKSKNDIISLWKIIRATHLTEPASQIAQLAAERNKLFTYSQKNVPIETYNKNFDFQLKKVQTLLAVDGRRLEEKEIVERYLLSLNPKLFKQIVKDMMHNKVDTPYPNTLTEAKSQILEWYYTETSTDNVMDGDKKAEVTANVSTSVPEKKQPGGNSKKNNKSKRDKKKIPKNDEKKAEGDSTHKGGIEPAAPKDAGKPPCPWCASKGFAGTSHTMDQCRGLARAIRENTKANGKSTTASVAMINDQDVIVCISDAQPAGVAQQSEDIDDLIVLDNACTGHVIRNRNLLENVQELSIPVGVKGIGGQLTPTHQGELKGFGSALYDRNASFNLISWETLRAAGYQFKYDNIAAQFTCMNDNIKHVFELQTAGPAKGLYGSTYIRKGAQVQAYAGREGATYTAEEIRRGREAMLLHERTDHMTDAKLCTLLDNGAIVECNTTSRDVRIGRDIFGPCAGCIQGNMTEAPAPTNPKPEVYDIGEKFHTDVFFIRDGSSKKVPYLMAVESVTDFKMAIKLVNKQSSTILTALYRVIGYLESHGHKVKLIRSDRESVFTQDIADQLMAEKHIRLEQSSAGRHERVAERAIRTLKDRMRCTIYGLPYKLPRKLLPFLLQHVMSSLNMTPTVHTTPLCPREKLTGRKINSKHAFRAAFGDFLYCKIPATPNAPASPDEPRSELGIMVGRDIHTANIKVYVPERNIVVNRIKFTRVPATTEKNQLLDAMASADLNHPENGDLTTWDELADTPPQSIQELYIRSNQSADERVDSIIVEDAVDLMSLPTSTEESGDTSLNHESGDALRSSQTNANSEVHKGATPVPHTPTPVTPVPALRRGLTPTPHTMMIPRASTPTTPRVMTPYVSPPPPKQVTFEDIASENSKKQTVNRNQIISIPRPTRANRTTWRDASDRKSHFGLVSQISAADRLEEIGLHSTVTRSLREHPEAALRAIGDEMHQLLKEKKVMHPVKASDLSHKERKKIQILPGHMFTKDKYLPNGEFERTKGRMAIGGNRYDVTTMDIKTSSPAADISSVMIIVAKAAARGEAAAVMDIPGAYLNANLKREHQPIMVIDAKTAAITVQMFPEYREFLRPDGTMWVRVTKALYGLPQSGLLWYEHIIKTLTDKLGYRVLESDKCVLTKIGPNGQQSTICLYVDDLLHTYTDDKFQEELLDVLTAQYGQLRLQTGNKLAYLGMQFTFNRADHSVTIDQKGYVDAILRLYNVQGTAKTPATADLFTVKQDLPRVNETEYASKVMKLMYYAKRTCPVILLTVCYLATRLKDCNEDDMDKLNRVLRYINANRDMCITLRADDLQVYAFVDGSYAVHIDAKSHGGLIISLGKLGAIIYCKSWKHKLVSRSSTEAEMISLHDALPQILWTKMFMAELGAPTQSPIIVYQDNKSTMTMSTKGYSNKGKSKHMDVRYFYIKEKIDNKEISLVHLPTTEMIADYLTKPLTGKFHRKLSKQLQTNCK